MFDDESASGGKKRLFFKTFHNDVMFTVCGGGEVKYPVQEKNVPSVQCSVFNRPDEM